MANESRIEELLQTIIDGGTYSDTGYEPSRNEEILISIITGEPYEKEPESRIEALLILLKAKIEGNLPEE